MWCRRTAMAMALRTTSFFCFHADCVGCLGRSSRSRRLRRVAASRLGEGKIQETHRTTVFRCEVTTTIPPTIIRIAVNSTRPYSHRVCGPFTRRCRQRRFLATKHGDTEPISRFHKLDPKGVCNTIRAGTASDRGAFTSPRPIHPFSPRCITVREAARLHSYPDWFRFHVTKWHGFRQIGNSVPPLHSQGPLRPNSVK